MAKINKINVDSVEYNISAIEVEPQQILNMTSTNKANDAEIKFQVPSTASDAKEGKVNGILGLNTKGNMAIESLNKHVNIEAAKGIQMKPTTQITLDTSRRTFLDKGNEVVIEAKFDDYDSEQTGLHPGDDEPFGEFKLHARAIDLRCYDHGGIALQPCGKDGDNFENKIKFESDRTNPITESAGVYNGEGGKGMEFGTFNNLHSSLFTNDYRFNKNGNVYAVTRGQLVTEEGKTDYPTQEDDFKDILDANLAATWEEIVNAAIFLRVYKAAGLTTQDLIDCVRYYKEQ